MKNLILIFCLLVSSASFAKVYTKDEVYQMINMERQKRGLPAVHIHKGLARTAQIWAVFMRYSLSHNMSFTKFYNRSGMECLTVGQDPVNSWMGSKNHKRLILSRGIKSMGLGYYRGKWVWRAFY